MKICVPTSTAPRCLNDDAFVAKFANRPDTVDGAIVEFNDVIDADRGKGEIDEMLVLSGCQVALPIMR